MTGRASAAFRSALTLVVGRFRRKRRTAEPETTTRPFGPAGDQMGSLTTVVKNVSIRWMTEANPSASDGLPM